MRAILAKITGSASARILGLEARNLAGLETRSFVSRVAGAPGVPILLLRGGPGVSARTDWPAVFGLEFPGAKSLSEKPVYPGGHRAGSRATGTGLRQAFPSQGFA